MTFFLGDDWLVFVEPTAGGSSLQIGRHRDGLAVKVRA